MQSLYTVLIQNYGKIDSADFQALQDEYARKSGKKKDRKIRAYELDLGPLCDRD